VLLAKYNKNNQAKDDEMGRGVACMGQKRQRIQKEADNLRDLSVDGIKL
jgi:hypothetical protein